MLIFGIGGCLVCSPYGPALCMSRWNEANIISVDSGCTFPEKRSMMTRAGLAGPVRILLMLKWACNEDGMGCFAMGSIFCMGR